MAEDLTPTDTKPGVRISPQGTTPLPLNPSTLDVNPRIPSFTSATLERGQFEVENDSKFGGLSCRHRLKACMHSYQSLPTKIRQTIRISAIVIASAIVLLAIIYLARIADKAKKYDEAILFQEHMQQNLHFGVAGPSEGENHRIYAESDVAQEGIIQGGRRTPLKLYKDGQGKVRYFNTDSAEEISNVKNVDISKNNTKPHHPLSKKHPATEVEIEKTLQAVRYLVDRERKSIQNKELRLWEPGTEPLRIILVSTWRSGSTFVSQALGSHPGVFEHFEPLSYLGVRQVRSGKEAFESQQTIHRLLDCQYQGLKQYMNFTRDKPSEALGHNSRVYQPCKKGSNMEVCFNETFMSEACKLFPIHLLKTVRLRLNLTQLLLNDEKLKVKVLFLVRDPRGTMNSRYSSVSWCNKNEDCSNPEYLCKDLEGDLKVSAAFQHLYPDKFMQIKYEDISSDAENGFLKIFNFLGLEYTETTRNFVKKNTNTNQESAWSVSRKSKERINMWKEKLPLEEIHAIQNACRNVIKILNYEFAGE